jgi:PAS domain S-box-containing protein
MPVALFIADAAGLIKFANRRACKTFGYELDELQGKNVRELLPREAGAALPEHPGTVTAKSEEFACRKNGTQFPASLHLRKIGPKDDELTLIAVEDLTKERELAQMRNDFLAMISHDLRAPLTALNGTISLLKDGTYGELPAPAMATLDSADDTLKKMVRLVNDLLQIEKMSSPNFSLAAKETRVADLFESALSIVGAAADKRDLVFVFETAEVSELKVRMDEDRIVQVLVNLMSNAVKYSPDGTQIKVRCKRFEKVLRFEVEDEGPGIPANAQELIFEKYRQIDAEADSRRGGAGLGLAIAKLIIEQHNGKIGVQSSGSHGTLFWFTLPI